MFLLIVQPVTLLTHLPVQVGDVLATPVTMVIFVTKIEVCIFAIKENKMYEEEQQNYNHRIESKISCTKGSTCIIILSCMVLVDAVCENDNFVLNIKPYENFGGQIFVLDTSINDAKITECTITDDDADGLYTKTFPYGQEDGACPAVNGITVSVDQIVMCIHE